MVRHGPPGRLSGRVVVVHAAGAEAAIALASEGATVVVVDTDARAAGEVAARIAAIGGRAAVFSGDLTNPDPRAALVELVDELFGERAST